MRGVPAAGRIDEGHEVKIVCERSRLEGEVEIPASKSHTIRAVAIGALAQGISHIRAPLESNDTRAALEAYRALGADIDTQPGLWTIAGTGGVLRAPENVIDVGNSGTTLRVAMGSAALMSEGAVVLTGDGQIRRRPSGPLAEALCQLGAVVSSTRLNGCPPFVVSGPLRGGETAIEAVTSQYLTSLLINAPLAHGESTINVPVLNEKPYVLMTLDWLSRQGVRLKYNDTLTAFHLQGQQHYQPVDRRIPADFSSATFFLCAGALGDNEVTSRGLDFDDTQGDRAVVDYLEQFGAEVYVEQAGIRVKAAGLTGCELDLNSTPDALPMMAVLGCFAEGETRLVNVPQARVKETDRISVMCSELARLGASIRELDDGLVIEHSALHGGEVDGHGDHRVVMALAIAGIMCPEPVTIDGYEAVAVTYPDFAGDLAGIGGKLRLVD